MIRTLIAATQNLSTQRALKGRGFSRVIKPPQIRGALAPERNLFKLAAIAAMVVFATAACAQQPLRIRLIDGKSGKALTPSSIRVATTPAETPRYLIPAADPASVLVYLKSAQTFTVSQQFKRCDVDRQDEPAATYSVHDILAQGVVTTNKCSSKINPIKPKPGELVLYVRHATPCELSKDHVNGISFCN